jgi:hypothetical protein
VLPRRRTAAAGGTSPAPLGLVTYLCRTRTHIYMYNPDQTFFLFGGSALKPSDARDALSNRVIFYDFEHCKYTSDAFSSTIRQDMRLIVKMSCLFLLPEVDLKGTSTDCRRHGRGGVSFPALDLDNRYAKSLEVYHTLPPLLLCPTNPAISNNACSH